jgi:hypothetical protein
MSAMLHDKDVTSDDTLPPATTDPLLTRTREILEGVATVVGRRGQWLVVKCECEDIAA